MHPISWGAEGANDNLLTLAQIKQAMPKRKLNKWLKVLIIVGGLLIALFIIGRFTNAIQFYTVPTISNYPSIKPGTHFFASNLRKPKRFDFICYRADNPYMEKQIYIHRLCGLPGDTVEMKKGRLYVNNRYADSAFTLAHQYALLPEDFEKIDSTEHYDLSLATADEKGRTIIYVADRLIKERAIKAEQQILEPSAVNEDIKTLYGQAWNRDNFGPIIVPLNQYFVLGDNRHCAQDSRYSGFIDHKDYVATFVCTY